MLLIVTNFVAIEQKSAYRAKYLKISCTNLYKLTDLVGIGVGIINLTFV